jgi:hypothetical protein
MAMFTSLQQRLQLQRQQLLETEDLPGRGRQRGGVAASALSPLYEPLQEPVQEPFSEPAPAPAIDLRALLPLAEQGPSYSAYLDHDRPGPSVLDDLGQPPIQPPTQPPVMPPAPPATPVALATVAAPPERYVGEPAVGPEWLQQREAAFTVLRADFESQRAQALADPLGVGWIDITPRTDRHGETVQPWGEHVVFIPDPEPTLIGYDEGGPVYSAQSGRWRQFNEETFAAHENARLSAAQPQALQSLAALYGTDVPGLLARHPELLAIARSDHALNAGPAPAGRAMGDASQLAVLDLYMADPQIAALVRERGGQAEPPHAGIALEQARLYGTARYEQLSRLATAMAAVRGDYSNALNAAWDNGQGQGVGWSETATGATDESGVPGVKRQFEPDTFTRWYTSQDGASNQAFAQFYGQSHTQWSTDESGQLAGFSLRFDNPSWQISSQGAGMSHVQLVSLDPNHAPRLNNDGAVGFDLEAGWATHHSNIHQRRDWLEPVMQVVVIGVVSWATAGAASAALGASFAGTTAGAAIVGAAAGAAGAVASGVMNDNLSFKGVLRGALTGAVTAGVVKQFGLDTMGLDKAGNVTSYSDRVLALTGRATLQGALQDLAGGRFREGFTAGLASGLGSELGRTLNQQIAGMSNLSAAERASLQMATRVLGSAVTALGNPDDPNYGFAQALVGGLVSDGLSAAQQTAAAPGLQPGFAANPGLPVLDDEGQLQAGVLDPAATPLQQAHALAQHLQQQGMGVEQATQTAIQQVGHSLPRAAAPALPSDTPTTNDSDGSTTIVITGRALPRDPLGNAYETDAQGRQLVYLAGGAGIVALNPSDALPLPGRLVIPSARVLELLARAAVPIGLIAMPGNAGRDGYDLQLSDNTRYRERAGEWGQVLELQSDGSWLAREGRYSGRWQGSQFVAIDVDAGRPTSTTTPALPPGNPSPPPLALPDWAARPEALPPSVAGPPAAAVPGYEEQPLSPQDLIIQRQDSEALGASLGASGKPRPDGYEAHHIVPSRAGGEDMEALRQRLVGLGLDLNDAANGVWLPGPDAPVEAPEAYHRRLNNRDYNEAVVRAFDEVTTLQEAKDVLSRIGSLLQQGGARFPGIRPRD